MGPVPLSVLGGDSGVRENQEARYAMSVVGTRQSGDEEIKVGEVLLRSFSFLETQCPLLQGAFPDGLAAGFLLVHLGSLAPNQLLPDCLSLCL